MDNFNAKKDRMKKLKNDTFRDRKHKKKGNTSQGTKSKPSGPSATSKEGGNLGNNEEVSSSNSESESNEFRKYSRGKIVSNQSYYEESLPDTSSTPATSTLEELAAADDVTGGIFQFKDEVDWASCPENISNQYFHLDLRQLTSSLAAVPFYERIDLSDDFYSLDEKQKMDNEAAQNYKLYSRSLNSAEDMKGLDQFLTKMKSQQNQEAKPVNNVVEPDHDNVSALMTQFKNIPSDLSDLLSSHKEPSVPTQKSSKVKVEAAKKKSNDFSKEETEDLTVWLDSILDD